MTILSDEQKLFVEQAINLEAKNQNMILSGRAGTGKSVCLRALKQECDRRSIKMRIVAPTGVAALNVGGITIARYIGYLYSVLRGQSFNDNAQLLVIDECSMVRADTFDQLDEVMRKVTKFRSYGRDTEYADFPFGGRRVVLVGDLMQLPPVVTDRDNFVISKYGNKPYFYKAKAFEESNWSMSFLTKTYRQADGQTTLKEILEAIRVGGKFAGSAVEYLSRTRSTNEVKGVGITGANSVANTINMENLNKLEGNARTYEAEIYQKTQAVLEKKDYPAEQILELKIGARVVCLKNIYEGTEDLIPSLCNGDSGEIVDMRNDSVTFHCDRTNSSCVVGIQNWDIEEVDENGSTIKLASFSQIPFRLAWCLTVHKSQGMTLEEVTIIPGRGFWENGQLYVALSRATCLEKLWVKGNLSHSDVRVCEEAVRFINEMTSEASA